MFMKMTEELCFQKPVIAYLMRLVFMRGTKSLCLLIMAAQCFQGWQDDE